MNWHGSEPSLAQLDEGLQVIVWAKRGTSPSFGRIFCVAPFYVDWISQ